MSISSQQLCWSKSREIENINLNFKKVYYHSFRNNLTIIREKEKTKFQFLHTSIRLFRFRICKIFVVFNSLINQLIYNGFGSASSHHYLLFRNFMLLRDIIKAILIYEMIVFNS